MSKIRSERGGGTAGLAERPPGRGAGARAGCRARRRGRGAAGDEASQIGALMTEQGNGAVTRTDVTAEEWLVDDEVTHLREWGTHRTHPLPPGGEAWTIGVADTCALRLNDPT